ncbi:MAG: zinc ribbon domain-containing protein [Oscillospiraceae bacterium]|jgi:hypothetical protein|nr:zinc ribbon domain-containing protein [Oscillospiraceae bacterium]
MADRFCTNCGGKLPEQTKFCTACGAQQPQPQAQPQQFQPQQYQQPAPAAQPYPAYPQQQPYAAPPAAAKPKKKHKGLKILLGFVGAIVLLIVSIAALKGKAASMDYYKIQNERVPSIKYVLGEKRKVSGAGTEIRDGMSIKSFKYLSDTPEQDMDAYYAAMVEKEGYTRLADPETMEVTGVGRNSEKPGHHIEVTATPTSTGYTISVYYIQGELQMINASDDPEPSGDDDDIVTQPSNVQPPVTQAPKPPAGDDTKFTDTADYFFIGPDKVPTVNKAVGYRKSPSSATSTWMGAINIQVDYLSDSPGEDTYNYVLYLQDNDGFVCLADVDTFATPEGEAIFGRNSVEAGQRLIMTVTWDSGGYNVHLQRAEGEIVPNG